MLSNVKYLIFVNVYLSVLNRFLIMVLASKDKPLLRLTRKYIEKKIKKCIQEKNFNWVININMNTCIISYNLSHTFMAL